MGNSPAGGTGRLNSRRGAAAVAVIIILQPRLCLRGGAQ